MTVEILKEIRTEVREGLRGVREEIGKTNARLDHTVARLVDVKDMQDLLVVEHRKTNARLDFFAEELVRMRTRDNERLVALETAVAEIKKKVG